MSLNSRELLERLASANNFCQTLSGHRFDAAARWQAAAGGVVNSLIVVGAEPVILGDRVISCTGDGGIGEFFRAPTVTLAATPVKQGVYNLYDGLDYTPLFALYASDQFTLTADGDKCFGSIYFGGGTTNQSQGTGPTALGEPRILQANTRYLLRITSYDTASQYIQSRLTFTEGDPLL